MENPTVTKLTFLIDFDFSDPEKSLEQISAKLRELAEVADRALTDIRGGRGWANIN